MKISTFSIHKYLLFFFFFFFFFLKKKNIYIKKIALKIKKNAFNM